MNDTTTDGLTRCRCGARLWPHPQKDGALICFGCGMSSDRYGGQATHWLSPSTRLWMWKETMTNLLEDLP